jgi:hypothetical protein
VKINGMQEQVIDATKALIQDTQDSVDLLMANLKPPQSNKKMSIYWFRIKAAERISPSSGILRQ